MKVVIRPQRLIKWLSFQSMYGSQCFAVGEREISILLITIQDGIPALLLLPGRDRWVFTYYVHKKEKSHVHLLHIAL